MARGTAQGLGIALAALALTSCASNSQRLARGHSVASAGSEAVKASKAFLTTVRAARDEANLTIVASQPSCAWADSIVVADQSAGPLRPFCVAAGETRRPGDFDYPLRPISEAALRPTLTSIGALAAYLGAVNAIVDRKGGDAGAELADAYAKARDAQSDLAVATATKLDIIPALTTKQTAAIADLVRLVDELASEHHKVDDLRRLVAGQHARVAALIDDLSAQVALWGRVSLKGSTEIVDNFVALDGYRLGEAKAVADFDGRRKVIERIQKARKGVADGAALTASLIATLNEVKAAQAAFEDGLSAHPHWSAKERARAAALNRQRLVTALRGLAAVAVLAA